MPKPFDQDDADAWELQRDQIIGLGERSFRKSYYPELRRNLSQLERFRALLDFAGEMVLLVALPDGMIIDTNAAIAKTLGQPIESLIGCRLDQIGLRHATEIIATLAQDATDSEAPIRNIEDTVQTHAGPLPIDLAYRIAKMEGGLYGVLLGRDARARVAAEARLRLAARVFAESAEGIIITDAQSCIVEVNRAFETITGYSRAEIAGKNPSLFSSGYHGAEFYRTMWATLHAQGHWQGEIWNRRKNGEVYPEWLSLNAIRDEEGIVCNYVAMFSDITEMKANEARRKADEARIQHMAHHDFLTGLPNRFLLNDRFGQLHATARRNGTRFAVIFIDLDRFKNVNDTLGHTVGDQLLCTVAQRLCSQTRASDTVSRQGGDEFIVLLSEITEPDDAGHAALKLIRVLGEPCILEGHELTITPSIGIAISPDDGEDMDTLLKHADLAMYNAKQQGRNNFQFFRQEMNTRTLELLVLENQLRQALKREEFELFYQPQVNLASNQTVIFEALVRWRHPERGLVSPTDFIPLAEETGLILPLGLWVLQEACRQVAVWRRGSQPEIRVAVNLSAIQFRQPDLAEQVRYALDSAAVESNALELEVTESMVMQDAELTIQTLQALRAMGVTLAIDDFGTGYSSLAYLKRFPVNTLKLDRSFVRDLADDPDAVAICTAVIGLARNLRLEVVAEGVETGEQLVWLRSAGCQVAQGFLLGRPAPAGQCAGMDELPNAVASVQASG
jgi:diguanylate cyclase (GGDEF)-like protein/PAS domain S-box-containing protein